MANKIDTGIVQTVKVDLPRPLPVGRGRGATTIKQGTIAVHAGETVESVKDFAAAICEAWAAHSRNWSWGEPTGKDMTLKSYALGSDEDIAYREAHRDGWRKAAGLSA